MLKLIGAIFVICACSALSLKHIIKKHRTILALRELTDTLAEIKRAISFSLEPLPSIISRLSKEASANANAFIHHLNHLTEEGEPIPLGTSWKQAFEEFAREYALPGQTKNIMNTLGDSLGKMDSETERDRLAEAILHLTKLADTAETEHRKNEKMIKSLGVILGIFIVILFL